MRSAFFSSGRRDESQRSAGQEAAPGDSVPGWRLWLLLWRNLDLTGAAESRTKKDTGRDRNDHAGMLRHVSGFSPGARALSPERLLITGGIHPQSGADSDCPMK
ncbi:unnamed protein product [Arctogadus glacialis]